MPAGASKASPSRPACCLGATVQQPAAHWRETTMRTVALEEHYSAPALSARVSKEITHKRGYRPRSPLPPGAPNPLELLPDFGEQRLKSMDDNGITVQAIGNSGPGRELLP